MFWRAKRTLANCSIHALWRRTRTAVGWCIWSATLQQSFSWELANSYEKTTQQTKPNQNQHGFLCLGTGPSRKKTARFYCSLLILKNILMGVKEFAVRYKAELNMVEITPNNTNSCTKFPMPLCTILLPVALQRGTAPLRSARTALPRLSAFFRMSTAWLCSAPPAQEGRTGPLSLLLHVPPHEWVLNEKSNWGGKKQHKKNVSYGHRLEIMTLPITTLWSRI